MRKKTILPDSEISAFCEQLTFMLKSGVSMQEGLSLLSTDMDNDQGAEIMLELLTYMEQGNPFSRALELTGRFPKYMMRMVEIGETSGDLDVVLDSLRQYYERNEAINRSIRSAVTYPLVMIVMMLVVIIIIITQVLPVFQNVFQQLGAEMSTLAQGIIQFGQNVSRYSVVIGVVIAAVVVAFIILRNTRAGNAWLRSIYEMVFRKTNNAISAGRFASSMALMLKSGVDVDMALDMSQGLIHNKGILRKIQKAKDQIAAGSSFADAIVHCGLFSKLYGKMIVIGFKTGTQDVVMQRIANYYEDEAARRINGLIAAIEPTLVAILSVIVGLILLSVMLPLMGVMTAIG